MFNKFSLNLKRSFLAFFLLGISFSGFSYGERFCVRDGSEIFNNSVATAKLSISKVVTGSGGDKSKIFTYSVKSTAMSSKTVNAVRKIGGAQQNFSVSFSTSGEAKVQLAHGQSVELELPLGIAYSVTELDADDYEVSSVVTYSIPGSSDYVFTVPDYYSQPWGYVYIAKNPQPYTGHLYIGDATTGQTGFVYDLVPDEEGIFHLNVADVAGVDIYFTGQQYAQNPVPPFYVENLGADAVHFPFGGLSAHLPQGDYAFKLMTFSDFFDGNVKINGYDYSQPTYDETSNYPHAYYLDTDLNPIVNGEIFVDGMPDGYQLVLEMSHTSESVPGSAHNVAPQDIVEYYDGTEVSEHALSSDCQIVYTNKKENSEVEVPLRETSVELGCGVPESSIVKGTHTTQNCQSVTIAGENYQTVLVNGYCWMRENLRTETANSYVYNSPQHQPDVATFGRLYSRADAASLCPEGWHLPSKIEVAALATFLSEDLRSAEYWVVAGNNSSGFSAAAAGFYNSDTQRFEGAFSETFFHLADEDFVFSLNYYCCSVILERHNSDDAFSVRCVADE